MSEITFSPIGVIHSPFTSTEGMPIQPGGAHGIQGTIELNKELVAGLKDIEGFSHLILIYYFHLSQSYSLNVTPFMDTVPHGVFATRAPKRPNQIGISVVKLLTMMDKILHIENVDVIDGTPLLDIKPYIPEFDSAENISIGWLTDKIGALSTTKADNRI